MSQANTILGIAAEREEWLAAHVHRYDRAIEQYNHLANYFSMM